MNELNQSMIIEKSASEICFCKVKKYSVNPKIADLFSLMYDEIDHAGELINYTIDGLEESAECDCNVYDRINNLSDSSKKKLMELLKVLEGFDKMKQKNIKYL